MTFEQDLGHPPIGHLVLGLMALYTALVAVSGLYNGELHPFVGLGLMAAMITVGPWFWRRVGSLIRPGDSLTRREVVLTDYGITVDGRAASWQSLVGCEVGYGDDGGARIELDFADGRVVHLWGSHVWVGDLDALVIFMHELRAAVTVGTAQAAAVRYEAARLLDR